MRAAEDVVDDSNEQDSIKFANRESEEMGISVRMQEYIQRFVHMVEVRLVEHIPKLRLTSLQRRYSTSPEAYQKFLSDIQHLQQSEGQTQEVVREIRNLLSSSPELLQEFKEFRPAEFATPVASTRSL